MTDFLLELRCEEIPARMQAGARADLERLLRKELDAAGVTPGELTVWSTPRRLALIARDLPEATQAVSEEVKGPKTSAPAQALEGFLRKTGLTQDQLTTRDGVWFAITEKPGRATREVLADAVPAIVRAFPWPKSMRWGAASISTESVRWVRPLSGIVAILGEDLIECEVGGVRSGYATLGHRFHHPGEITIGGAGDYQEKLRACHVVVDHEERQDLIRDKAKAAASAAGLMLVEDEGLVIENAGLTEWPVPLLGRFDEAFLDVPPEVIQLTARTNQKYFVCRSPLPHAGGVGGGPVREGADDRPSPNPSRTREGDFANAFVCTANIEATDGGAGIVAGNRKVLAARLSDARFFWEQDRKTPLAEQARKLERITFHEKLGTVADKVERVAKLARWLCEQGIVKSSLSRSDGEGDRAAAGGVVEGPAARAAPPSGAGAPATSPSPLRDDREDQARLAKLAEQAARLCKADLVTEMVGEFPELQGLMGGYYARAEGLPEEVADAIRDHYKPVGQGDEVPTAPVTVAVSLADKLDTLLAFFDIDELPTGSKDPFALRRAAIAIIRLILHNGLEVHTDSIVEAWLGAERLQQRGLLRGKALDFLLERLSVQLRDLGIRHDFVQASRVWNSAQDGRIDRVGKRAAALQAFVGTEDGTNLLAGYKRAANILKKENWTADAETRISRTGEEDPLAVVDDPDLAAAVAARLELQKQLSYTPEPAEQSLIDALDSAGPQAATAVQGEDFAAAMAALASLRGPIDRFFDEVTVNDENPDKRAARLALLGRFRDAVHAVADFSRIEG